MLKIGKVYLYNEKTYYYVADKYRYKGRITYKVYKVLQNGGIGLESKILFKTGKFKLCPKIKVSIHIEIPKVDKEKIRYEAIVEKTREMLITQAKHGGAVSEDFKRFVSLSAFAATGHILKEKSGSRKYTFRDFAKSLKLKSNRTLYKWLEDYLETQFTDNKYKILKTASSGTIVKSVRDYQTTWKSYYGFSKKLNMLFERDLAGYTKELKERGLNV